MKRKGARLVSAVIFLTLLLLAMNHVEGNSRFGGATPGVISDVPMTVREIEERADIRWSINTAAQWVVEDERFCRAKSNGAAASTTPYAAFVACMHERLGMRMLYMLRRNCVGVNAIGEICRLEDE